MTTSESTLSDRLAALVAKSGAGATGDTAPDTALADRLEDLADLTDGLRADLGTLHASGDQQAAALGRLEQQVAGVQGQVDQLGQTVRAELVRLEAALGQRDEEAALALAETLLARPSE